MTLLNRVASQQGRRDQTPNQDLARELTMEEDQAGIREIAENLWNKDRNIQSNCLKVLYEIGYSRPELIADYVGDFLELLSSKKNRLIWGSMIALSTIATIKAHDIYPHVEEIVTLMDRGSVITQDNAVKVLTALASSDENYRDTIFPSLLKHLENCRPKDVPQHAESTVIAVDAASRDDFIRVLESRMDLMSPTQASRIKKVIKQVRSRSTA